MVLFLGIRFFPWIVCVQTSKWAYKNFLFQDFEKLIILGLTWCIPCVTIAKGRSGEDSVSPTDSSMSSSSNSSKSDTTVINTVSKTQTTSKTVILNNGLSCKSLQRSGSLSSNCRSKLLVCSRIFEIFYVELKDTFTNSIGLNQFWRSISIYKPLYFYEISLQFLSFVMMNAS